MKLILAIVAVLALPTVPAPDLRAAGPGGLRTAHGCVISLRNAFPGAQAALDDAPGKNAKTDAQWYERELHSLKAPSQRIDYLVRQPLSIAYYRLHRVHEAAALWRLILSNPYYGAQIHAGTLAVMRGEFGSAFVRYARSPFGFDPVYYDTGAAYNLQRGLNAAATANYRAAETFLRYSAECSASFQEAPFMIGILDAMQHRFTSARHEWLKTLQNREPEPPDTAGITPVQLDAIRLLLHYD